MSPVKLRVAAVRQFRGWTREELSQASGLSVEKIEGIEESDGLGAVDLPSLDLVARALGVHPAALTVVVPPEFTGPERRAGRDRRMGPTRQRKRRKASDGPRAQDRRAPSDRRSQERRSGRDRRGN